MVAESLHAFVCCLRVPHSALIARRYCHGRGDFVVGKLFNVTLPDRKCWRWWVTLTTDRRTDTATCSSSSSSTVDAAECQRWWLRHLWPGQTNRQTDRQTDRQNLQWLTNKEQCHSATARQSNSKISNTHVLYKLSWMHSHLTAFTLHQFVSQANDPLRNWRNPAGVKILYMGFKMAWNITHVYTNSVNVNITILLQNVHKKYGGKWSFRCFPIQIHKSKF